MVKIQCAPTELVTVFNPRWAYVPLTPSTFRIHEHLKKEKKTSEVKLIDFLTVARKMGYESLWIYAELADLGLYLKDKVPRDWSDIKCFHPQIEESETRLQLPMFERENKHDGLLRMFIYGGSLSSYLNRKNTRYLSLDLSSTDSGNEGNEWMKTYIAYPNENQELGAQLGKYHKKLYADAKNKDWQTSRAEECPPFFSVYRGYNEMSWLLQHRSSFENATEYRDCLADHHIEVTS